jgi:putative hydrolase of the HAD superfamily
MMINGFIFDFDGLMIDTEMPRYNAWQEKFADLGYTFVLEDYLKIVGSANIEYDPAVDLSQRTNGRLPVDEINSWVETKSQEIILHQPLLPGVKEIILNAYEQGIKLGVASSSIREWVVPLLEQHDIARYFDVVLTREDVKNVKPDPELYLKAMEKLALSPGNTVAFEDSVNGLKSAKSAGMFCVAIPGPITRHMDFHNADKIVDSFNELTISQLRQIGQ